MKRSSRQATRWTMIIAIATLAVVLPACRFPAAKGSDDLPALTMSAATMSITKVELTARFPPGCSPGPTCQEAVQGHQMLAVWLERQDGGDISEINEKLFGETISLLTTQGSEKAYVVAKDGSKTGLAMTSVVGSSYVLVFAPSSSARGFKLVWPNNPEIDLGK